MEVSDFNYNLPEELIAQVPLADRSSSRLLVLDKVTGEYSHHHFYEIVKYLQPGDTLVLNDTRVIPARLIGVKLPTMSPIEFVLLKRLSDGARDDGDFDPERPDHVYWEVILRPGKHAHVGTKFMFGEGAFVAEVLEITEGGNRIVRMNFKGVFEEILDKVGVMPLPPYIKTELEDPERYQTVYSRENGSAAAPTAGLHFTKDILKELEEKGVNLAFVTLHVGLGTFRPVKETKVEDHLMHSEYYEITREACNKINSAKKSGHRVVCVGTTSCRVVETAGFEKPDSEGNVIAPTGGWTQIFIYPGYKFKVLDALITNFHLPQSTLLMLVSSLAGRENILRAYEVAVEEKYRFFSFGDAMFIK